MFRINKERKGTNVALLNPTGIALQFLKSAAFLSRLRDGLDLELRLNCHAASFCLTKAMSPTTLQTHSMSFNPDDIYNIATFFIIGSEHRRSLQNASNLPARSLTFIVITQKNPCDISRRMSVTVWIRFKIDAYKHRYLHVQKWAVI